MKKIETLSTNNLEKFQKEKLKHKIEPSKNKNFKGEFGEKKNNQRIYYGFHNNQQNGKKYSQQINYNRFKFYKNPSPASYFRLSNRNISSDQSQKYKFIQRELLAPKDLVGKTQYIPFTNQDLMYLGNFQRYNSQDFQIIIKKATRDLNLLLHFEYQYFWKQLTTSESLRKALYSYLQNLPCLAYQTYTQKNITQDKVSPSFLKNILKNQNFQCFRQFLRIILLIYHRILCQSQSNEKQTLYQFWLFDIPKMLSLISIYKNSNIRILNQIIHTAFEQIPHYQNDMQQFSTILMEKILPALQNDFNFEFIQKNILQNKNFANPLESFTRNLMRTFFRTFDVFNTLCDLIQFFPTQYTLIVLSQPTLIINLIEIYFRYCQKIEIRWELTDQFKQIFTPTMQKIRQKMIEFFLNALDFIDYVLEQSIVSETWKNCLYIHFTLCKKFVNRKQTLNSHRWLSLINLLISETSHRYFFRFDSIFSQILYPEQMNILEQCLNYEIKLRKQLHRTKFNNNQVVQIALGSIKNFKEWKDFSELKKFDQYDQGHLYMGSVIQQDSVLLMIQNEMETNLEKKNSNPTNNLYDRDRVHKRRKKEYFPEFSEMEYNDEPIDQLTEQSDGYCSYGLEGLEEIQAIEEVKQTEVSLKRNERK